MTIAPSPVIPARLDVTLAQFRAKAVGELGSIGLPAPHWPLTDPTTNDCLGFLTWAAGIREADDYTSALVRISAFRASAGWPEVAPHELRSGDWALYNWDSNPDADHVEFLYGIDFAHAETDTVSANTGPRPGVPEPRGVYRKQRAIDEHLIGGIRPPYLVIAPTASDVAAVRRDASYLNRTMPASYHDPITDRTIVLHRTGAGAGSPTGGKGDGIRGPLYRLLVQVWGRMHRIYPDACRLDGIFGRQSERVEDRLDVVAKAYRG